MRNVLHKSKLPRLALSRAFASQSPEPLEPLPGMEIIKCQQHNIVYVLSRGHLININNVYAVTLNDCHVNFHIPTSSFKELSFSYLTSEDATKDFNRLASHIRHQY